MWIFFSAFGAILEAIFWPFRNQSPWIGMVVISLLTGLLMLLIFRLTSNQEGIRRTKNKIKAHLLELRLYRDNLPVSLNAYGKIFLANMRYIGHSAKPMLVMIVPILLILIQLNLWFGFESLAVGEEALVKVKLEPGRDPWPPDFALKPSAGISVETPPLRIEESREIDWRLRARDNGIQSVVFEWGANSFSKKVSVGQSPLSKISAVKPGPRALDQIFNPGEKPLPGDLGIRSVEVTYPSARLNLFGWRLHWLVVFFALSIIFGFALKGVFKVEI